VPKDSTNPSYVNFANFDNLVLELDYELRTVPDIKDRDDRVTVSICGRNKLFRMYNFVHGLDVEAFCNGDGLPTTLTQDDQEERWGGECC
jgi:hypothetical protein